MPKANSEKRSTFCREIDVFMKIDENVDKIKFCSCAQIAFGTWRVF